MTQTVIQIKTELEKANAIRIYLSGKELDLERELTDYIDALYKKHVPAQVREYIEKADSLELDADINPPPRRAARRKPVSGADGNGGTDSAAED